MRAFRINSRVKRAASFLLGAGLLVWLAVSSGIGSILADLSRVGPGLIVILALEFVIDAFNTLGWWFTLPVDERAGNYCRLFWVRCAGSALNESTPAASVGGEPAKIVLLRGRISISSVTASLLATKVSFCFSTAIFIVAGMAVVWSEVEAAVGHFVGAALWLHPDVDRDRDICDPADARHCRRHGQDFETHADSGSLAGNGRIFVP